MQGGSVASTSFDNVVLPRSVGLDYQRRVTHLRRQLEAYPRDAPVRLAKTTTNVFRMRQSTPAPGLRVDGFAGVLHIDPAARTADVLGMTTYEQLVDATLAFGLMPKVVPQLKAITLGGAITGLGIESTSFREGLPHESVVEMDILTGAGEIVTATPHNEHANLYFGFPNSYGTLGYALRLRIELAPVTAFVALRHVRFRSLDEAAGALAAVTDTRLWDGQRVDFVDGTVFGAEEVYLSLGSWTDSAPHAPSVYSGNAIYYKSIRSRSSDVLTVRDYIWRWDTDWFWCSAALGVQRPWLRPLIPRRYLRSDVYHRAVSFGRRSGLVDAWARLRREPLREYVIQDIEVPVDRLAQFMEFFDREVGISPVWLCPLRQRDPHQRWPLYSLDPETTYVNVGFWSSVPQPPGSVEGSVNRAIEVEVERLGGRKSLYSSSYYSAADFWRIYNGDSYRRLKQRYDSHGRLLDLYEKCVTGR